MPRADDADAAGGLRADLAALHGAAWRWALTCCRGDEERAMETLQDAYLLILEGRARHAGRSRFKTFVFGVIRNTGRRVWAKTLARRMFTAPIEAADGLGAPAPQEAAARTPAVDAALAALAPRQRQAAELVLLHDLTVAEAAAVMGVSRGSAARHYALAKDALRARLGVTEAGDDG